MHIQKETGAIRTDHQAPTIGEIPGGVTLVDTTQGHPIRVIRICIKTIHRAADTWGLYSRRGSCDLDGRNRWQGDDRSWLRKLMGREGSQAGGK